MVDILSRETGGADVSGVFSERIKKANRKIGAKRVLAWQDGRDKTSETMRSNV